ncbi:MAG TPA: hypothetical protein VFX43_01050 [Chitinophagaceae bacterium]|jgi:hypothetical protein|nr:hypothetical protein [Chitinophagaceae bacterium]
MLAMVDENGQRVVNAGKHKIYIAAAVPAPRSVALDSLKPVSVTVAVK